VAAAPWKMGFRGGESSRYLPVEPSIAISCAVPQLPDPHLHGWLHRANQWRELLHWCHTYCTNYRALRFRISWPSTGTFPAGAAGAPLVHRGVRQCAACMYLIDPTLGPDVDRYIKPRCDLIAQHSSIYLQT
jgi:hypothetical protein